MEDTAKSVRVRMAPSPTGNLHLGTAYATLWPYLFAKKNKGTFLLRIEDTDVERSKKEFEENIIQGLKWLGLDWDEGPYHQMERLDAYKKALDQLIDKERAYYCFCTQEELDTERKRLQLEKKPLIYSGKCRSLSTEEASDKIKKGAQFVVRLKVASDRGVIKFEDILHGEIAVDSRLIGDTVIMRRSGIPLYNFAVVVDDIDMKISHVIRGEDHISNTPKQVLIFEAMDSPLPKFAHYPVILNQDRVGKLSKRAGSTSVDDYKKDGYLSEVLINYLALLGWSPKNDKEIFTKEELITIFDLKDMGKAPAAWNEQKLDWLNGEYIRAMSDEELTIRLQGFLVDHPAKDKISVLVPLIKERIKKLSDFVPLTNFIYDEPEYDLEVFEKLKIKNFVEVLEQIKERLGSMKNPWNSETFEKIFRDLSDELNITAGDMFQLIRVAVSGQLVTPPLFESIQIIGEEIIKKRIENLLKKLKNI